MPLKDSFFYYTNKYKDFWYSIDGKENAKLQAFSDSEKLKNESEINRIIDSILDKLNTWPSREEDRKKWAYSFMDYIQTSLSDISIDECFALKHFIISGIMDITKSFVQDALKNPELGFDDIAQAIRNAWIMNILQLMLNIKVEYTNSIFGYSMLYPYTDNLIDSNITLDEKKLFNNKFHKRLNGENVKPSGKAEQDIYHMVELIEKQFDRDTYPDVYESLLLIHKSQIDSLIQQATICPFDKDIIDISFKKGGSSVLADGYLVKGQLSEDELKFTLGFGIMLQLCDDIQDIQDDINLPSATIFSLASKSNKLDILANKLFKLIDYVYTDDINKLSFEHSEKITPFMKQCCNFIVLDGIMTHKKYFSKGYIKSLKKYLPVTPKFLQNIKIKTSRRFDKIMKQYDENELKTIITYINM